MADNVSFKGVMTELITPFTEDGQVDYPLLRGEVAYQLQNGIKALFTNGIASESLSLTAEELIETTKTVVEAAGDRALVMGNIACQTLPEAMQVLRGYEAAGVDAVCIQQPCVYSIPQEELVAYFDAIASATALPAGIYNAPQTGNTLSPASVAAIFKHNENMQFYKESTIDFVHIQNTMRLIGPDRSMTFLNGSDATTFSVMQLGGAGVVSLISAVFPKAVLKLVNAMEAGDIAGGRAAQNEILLIREALKTGPFVAGYKYAAGLMGVPLGYMRRPLAELSEDEKEKIKTSLEKLRLV
ncbi:4-hydroxy-tetrahydrodipicolinate synthase [Eubacterium callanderi]|uniref:dihydrodipicolinate synthase family protein n=1 Tax=Eubacterium callanderi TaxID=53442 RepID=UPI0029FEDCDE|nr:dihydrodipicolinate synthase family protein [Eubacterium callanderi]WPK66313.1 4-hydroxy-tetrahydrodipicolinate synthase [Eubacterium callanderi]WPK70611.1 4-hydroxy-tetrahydrodipicolinate synthase [Eubacterium callanderi]